MFDAVTLTMNPAIDLYTSVAAVEAEHKLRGDTPAIHAGGGGVNVARALAHFGCRPSAILAAGGRTGDWLGDLLEGEGIHHRRIAVTPNARENITVLDRSSGEQYRFVMPGRPLRDDEWGAALRALEEEVPRTSLVVASGSLPPGVPDRFYALVAEIVAAAGARFVLDAAGESLRSAIDHGVGVVSPNRRELDDLAGRRLDAHSRPRFAEELVAQGHAEVVVVKLDTDGAFVVSAGGSLHVDAPAVTVKSAVGAGDSFIAAFVAAQVAGWSLDDSVRLAVASGSAAVTLPGTELARLDIVAELWEQMTGTPMPPLETGARRPPGSPTLTKRLRRHAAGGP